MKQYKCSGYVLVIWAIGSYHAVGADLPNNSTCTENPIVHMICAISAGDTKMLDCESRVLFCQQGVNTHLYGRELRIRPRIVDNLSVEVQLIGETPFKPYNFKFNSEVNIGETQIVVGLIRPSEQILPVHLEGVIRVSGKVAE